MLNISVKYKVIKENIHLTQLSDFYHITHDAAPGSDMIHSIFVKICAADTTTACYEIKKYKTSSRNIWH